MTVPPGFEPPPSSGPPYTTGYPPQGSGPAPQYAPTPAYTQPAYPPAYPPGYGNAPLAWPPLEDAPPVKKSSTAGIIGLALVVVATVVTAWGWHHIFAALRATICPDLLTCVVPSDVTGWPPALANTVPSFTLSFIAGIVLGLGGLITSIVATAKKNGRTWGIIGILLGIAGPIVAVLVGYSLVAA